MQTSSQFLLTIGGILLLGLVTSAIGRRTFMPRVTLLLIFGVVIGEQVLNIVPDIFADKFELIADIALLMVGFLLGGRLKINMLRQSFHSLFWISVSAALSTATLVCAGLYFAGLDIGPAIILGCIASATAPAAVLDVVQESGSEGPFKDLLLAIVAIDDAWALILFAIGVTIAGVQNGDIDQASSVFLVIREIGGAVLLGLVVGIPAVYLTGRVKKGQPMLSEALGLVFVCGGLALHFEVSFLISAMVLGAVVVNFAKHHRYPFNAIEGIEWPFMVIFFVLAGASLDPSALADVGLIGLVYIVCRALGKVLGAGLGAQIAKTNQQTKNWMGLALLPQAGVAIGMALVASNQFPQYADVLLSITIGSTIFFEIVGPVAVRFALKQVVRIT